MNISNKPALLAFFVVFNSLATASVEKKSAPSLSVNNLTRLDSTSFARDGKVVINPIPRNKNMHQAKLNRLETNSVDSEVPGWACCMYIPACIVYCCGEKNNDIYLLEETK